MQLQTLLNNCQKHKSFVAHKASLEERENKQIVIFDSRARTNSRVICSGCHKPGPAYDHQKHPRYFEFKPMWDYAVFFRYTMRRGNYKQCDVTTESVPWCDRKNHLTIAYRIYWAQWARRLFWKEVADVFSTSRGKKYRSVSYVVNYGLKHRKLSSMRAIGVDEIQFGKGHKYLTLVYQIDDDCKRLLSVTKKRTIKSFLYYLRDIGNENLTGIKYVCSHMWPAYLKVIKKKLPNAIKVRSNKKVC